MKRTILNFLALGAALFAVGAQGAVNISFSGDGTLTFTPGGGSAGSFAFSDGPDFSDGYQWYSDDALYLGKITGSGPGGSFAFNNIQNVPFGGGAQVATITTAGTVTLLDYSLQTYTLPVLSATLNWNQLYAGYGYSGTIDNTLISLDLAPDPGYSGGNGDLAYLAAHGGYLTVQFQNTANYTLTQLATTGLVDATYNGAIASPVPETSTTVAGLGALGLVALLLGAQRRSRSVQAH